jgi:hypothetical protein
MAFIMMFYPPIISYTISSPAYFTREAIYYSVNRW